MVVTATGDDQNTCQKTKTSTGGMLKFERLINMTSACVDMPGKHLETRAWGSGAAGPGDAHLGVIGT